MTIFNIEDNVRDLVKASVVAIGVFDGVHLGHRALIEEAASLAKDKGISSVVLTFDRHPLEIINKDKAPLMIMDLEQKVAKLKEVGVDYVAVLKFDLKRSHQSAHEFIEEVLVGALNVRSVVVGNDFRFGRDREGSVEYLAKYGPSYGFEVTSFELVTRQHKFDEGVTESTVEVPISSTLIRSLLSSGELEKASHLLSRYPTYIGKVLHGHARGGAELGFPTANIEVNKRIIIPKVGVYASLVLLDDGRRFRSATSIGTRPTFLENAEISFETYILDLNEDIYERTIEVSLVQRIRDDKKFDSKEDLVNQMENDIVKIRSLLATISL